MNFAHPGWLVWLALLPILGVTALVVSRLRRRQWKDFVAPRLREALVKSGSALPRWLMLFFLMLASAAMIGALARPQGDAGTKVEKTKGRNVMIALDLSKSMRVADVKPDRLTQAKVVIYELLEAMPNERIGFIGFAGTPNLYAPLTVDHGAVRETIEQVDENWPPVGGSDLAAAVHLATETLKKTGQKNNALVILSDGEKHAGDLDAMIAEAEQSGVYIVAIGVGTENGDYVPSPLFPGNRMLDEAGQPVISRLQPEVMRRLAEETKGRFALAGSALDISALVKSVVAGLDAFEMEGRERKISIEFYQWLVLPGLVFLALSIIAGTRWRGMKLAVLASGFLLTTDSADASEVSLAKSAAGGNDHAEAQSRYHQLAETAMTDERQARYRLGEATAAYRAEDFRAARAAFSEALRSEDTEVQKRAHLGLGNSLFQLGWKSLSNEAYPAEASAVPDMLRFDTLVKEALAKTKGAEVPEDGDGAGYKRFESLITNWADAVRHYDSALKQFPKESVARQNRDLSVAYLQRLEELLKKEKEETEASLPQPGEGPPQEGDEGDPPGDGKKGEKGKKGKPGDKKDGEDGKGDEKEGEGPGGPKQDEEKEKEPEPSEGDPNETPEERAGRILKENSDTEKGPLSPGRREFQNPEKDW